MTIISGVKAIKQSTLKRMATALRIVVGIILVFAAAATALAGSLPNETEDVIKPVAVNDRNTSRQMYEVKLRSQIPAGPELLEQQKGKYLGTFCITHYCPCELCNGSNSHKTATGNVMIPYNTIAVDPRIIPLGSSVYIDGYGMMNAIDTGSGVNGYHIDVCVHDHAEAVALGVKYLEVYEI